MKQPIRYFSIGLLTSSIILLIIFTFFNDQGKATEEMSLDDMIATVQEDGYRVLSESDYITLAVSGDQMEEDEQDKKEDEKDKKEKANKTETKDDKQEKEAEEAEKPEDKDEEEKDEEVFTYTVHVKPNMLAPDVSQILVENKIIDDANKFTKYLEDEGYSKYIQLGKHKVSSDMSTKEIAEEITKY